MTFKFNPSAPGMSPSPNSVMRGEGFYISHNDHDLDIYGAVTTAVVLGQMERFYVLNGDHRRAYAELVPAGLEACLSYFRDNIELMNKRSDTLDVPVAAPKTVENEPASIFRP